VRVVKDSPAAGACPADLAASLPVVIRVRSCALEAVAA
jgi:hypothetical protein